MDTVSDTASRFHVGKVVTGFDWYMAVVVRNEEANLLSEGKNVYIQLDATGSELIEVKVERIGQKLGDEVVVILSSSDKSQTLLSLRKQAVNIVLTSYQGLKVPKGALRVDSEGQQGVYVVVGLYIEFKPVDILYESEDYYVVATDPSDINSLLENDEMVVTGKDISNKKVIK